MNREKEKRARLYVALEGPLVENFQSSRPVWTSRVFPSLRRISKKGVYALVLVSEEKRSSAEQMELLSYVADALRGQEIPVEEVLSYDALATWSGLQSDVRSWYVGVSPVRGATLLHAEPIAFTDWTVVEEHLVGPREQPLRTASVARRTKETDISLTLNLDGTGMSSISTGLPFFDHMLDQVARHARFDIDLVCSGDLEVDEHHTVEDVALVFGEATATALSDKRGISRYGFSLLPMDDCLAEVALDFSGRPWFVWNVTFSRDVIGTFPTELFSHFFKSFSDAAKCNLHLSVNKGNAHHQAEALFKAFARALRSAVFRYPGNSDLPSTKGLL